MRLLAGLVAACWLGAVAAVGCRSQPAPPSEPGTRPAAPSLSDLPPLFEPPPITSAAVALEQRIQSERLRPAPQPTRPPCLAFGKGIFGQLAASELRVFDERDFRRLASAPLVGPRALLTLADGALLAVGSEAMLRFEPGARRAVSLSRPALLPDMQLLADPIEADRIWIFDGAPLRTTAATPVSLNGFRLDKEPRSALPEQEIRLESARGGALGMSREGVWLYLTPGRAERLSPAGLRLSGLRLPEALSPLWVLPTRRLDQSVLLDAQGGLVSAEISPNFRQLGRSELGVTPLSAAVGDEGRLLAVIALEPGPGPRFSLQLFDAAQRRLANVALPSEPPNGKDDWLRVVTENQSVSVAPREPRVAVGGPQRVSIFDGQGKQIFSIPSQ
jgi:hypothetical protein